ncbi:ion channel [Francisella frigiditurris]|uniref:TrkA-N domain protein n=1 Tax=Francisella frigiditurris TaxID=1542390 RepID=A0A1J0KU49_9GAMM|nr:ion channel [Francisella frigiditurris]APC97293.1 trkA-N domain protein [Francisella frigiditurris]
MLEKINYKKLNIHQYVPLIVSITIALNGFITMMATAIPVINKMFSLHIDNNITSDIYDLGMKFNVGLGIAMPLILGYLMILIAKGIYQRKRFYWSIAVILITLSMLGDYIQDKHFSYNITFTVHAFEIVLLLTFTKVFNKKVSKKISYQQFIITFTFLLAVVYSVLGVYYLRNQFEGIETITDAVYFTFVTFSTVGYGDIHPVTQEAKMFTMSIMLLGIGVFATIVTLLASSVIGKIISRFKFKDGVVFMKNHVILCGYTEIAKYMIAKYSETLTDIVVIQENYKGEFIDSNDEGKKFIDAESSDSDALKQANIHKAKTIFILNDKDSDNILTLLAIKEILKNSKKDDLPFIAIKLDKEENINIANNIGVDQIVSPTRKVAEMLMNKHCEVKSFVDKK